MSRVREENKDIIKKEREIRKKLYDPLYNTYIPMEVSRASGRSEISRK